MNRSERRRENRRIENNYFAMKSQQDFSRMVPKHADVMKAVLNPTETDQKLAADLLQDPCFYCGDKEAPAMIIKERNNQVICIHCVNKGVGKYDTSWQRK